MSIWGSIAVFTLKKSLNFKELSKEGFPVGRQSSLQTFHCIILPKEKINKFHTQHYLYHSDAIQFMIKAFLLIGPVLEEVSSVGRIDHHQQTLHGSCVIQVIWKLTNMSDKPWQRLKCRSRNSRIRTTAKPVL